MPNPFGLDIKISPPCISDGIDLETAFDDSGKWLGTKEELTELLNRTPCCRYDSGGSHYHCGNCKGTSGMFGHHNGKEFRCPENPRIAWWDD